MTQLITISVIIICCVFFNKISHRIGMPVLLAFIFLGMLLGSDGIFKIHFDNYEFAERICSIGLLVIIFYGGFGTKWSEASSVAGKSLLLSSAGVIITALLTGAFCHYILNFSLLEGMLIGAVISSTDAASVFSVLRSRKLNLKYSTASVLELESGSNDPWAYMLTVIILSIMRGDVSSGGFVWMCFAQVFFGVLFGVIISFLAVKIMKRVRFETAGFDAIFVAGAALLSYALPTALGGNGYLSVYILGIVLGNADIPDKKPLVHFFDGVTGFMQILIFFLLGLLSYPSHIPRILVPAIAIMLFLSFFARPLMVFLLSIPFKSPIGQQALISWAGLRGATSIVFAIIATVDTAYTKSDVFHIVFCIVLISIGVQGTLLPLVAKNLKMIDNSVNVMKTFNDYTNETEVQFVRITVKEGGRWEGKKIKDLNVPEGMIIAVIFRDGERIVPMGKDVLMAGDILAICAEGFYDDSNLILSETTISENSVLCGMRLSEINLPSKDLVILIKRNERILIPHGRMKLKCGDVLVITSA